MNKREIVDKVYNKTDSVWTLPMWISCNLKKKDKTIDKKPIKWSSFLTNPQVAPNPTNVTKKKKKKEQKTEMTKLMV